MVVFMGYDSDQYYEYIHLSNKNITEIPKEWNIKCKGLNLGNNKIKKIPKEWLPQCKKLYLDYNYITKIPKEWLPQYENIYLNNDTKRSKNLKK